MNAQWEVKTAQQDVNTGMSCTRIYMSQSFPPVARRKAVRRYRMFFFQKKTKRHDSIISSERAVLSVKSGVKHGQTREKVLS